MYVIECKNIEKLTHQSEITVVLVICDFKHKCSTWKVPLKYHHICIGCFILNSVACKNTDNNTGIFKAMIKDNMISI